MEEKRMTVEEVLEITIRQLGEISVPVALYDQIAAPLKQNIGNLSLVLDALRKSKEENDGRAADAE